MTDQEKELIDYAAKQFEQAMMKSNPFPIGMSESISFTISTAIERSISINSHLLAEELKKINRVIDREYPEAFRETLVVLDATTGQNALAQAREFNEAADITGVVLTKMDGTAKGGIAVAIQAELGIPVKYIGVGETIDDLQKFDSEEFVKALFYREED